MQIQACTLQVFKKGIDKNCNVAPPSEQEYEAARILRRISSSGTKQDNQIPIAIPNMQNSTDQLAGQLHYIDREQYDPEEYLIL